MSPSRRKTTERYSTDIQELNTQLDKLAEYQQEIKKIETR